MKYRHLTNEELLRLVQCETHSELTTELIGRLDTAVDHLHAIDTSAASLYAALLRLLAKLEKAAPSNVSLQNDVIELVDDAAELSDEIDLITPRPKEVLKDA